MAPPTAATARRAPAARPSRPTPRRAPLRIFEPATRRPVRRATSRSPRIWLAVALVVASLLVVVVGDALVTQGQVRLADVQLKISAAQSAQKTMQTNVARQAAPDKIVAEASSLGLVAPREENDLPQVPLNVPLPAPDTAPVSTSAAATAR